MNYLKERLKERDTHVVLLSILYTIAASLIAPEHRLIVDGIAGAIGVAYAGTPIKKLK